MQYSIIAFHVFLFLFVPKFDYVGNIILKYLNYWTWVSIFIHIICGEYFISVARKYLQYNYIFYNILKKSLVMLNLSNIPFCAKKWFLSNICSDIQGFSIRAFIFIFNKNAYFLWKIIRFLFHSIAEGLLLIMKYNIIHMASRTTFAGQCSDD